MQRIHAPLIRSSVAALLLVGGATLPALAAVCNNVSFSFTNTSGGPIKVTKVGYRDLDSSNPGKRRVENVSDIQCPDTWVCTTAPKDLGSVTKPRENHELTDVQFFHSHQDAFGNWLPEVWSSTNVPADMTCTDNRNYGAYNVN